MTALLLALVAPASAWSTANTACSAGKNLPGNAVGWQLVNLSGHWTPAMEADIIEAAAAWDGGVGQRNRGYDWSFVNTGAGVGPIHSDGMNGVGEGQQSHFILWHLLPTNAIAVTTLDIDAGCDVVEFDIEALDTTTDGWTFTWTKAPPSASGESLTTTFSLPAVMVHEFGHGIGFEHSTLLSVMERRTGSELGTEGLGIHEDDYVGMRSLYPNTSSGKNFTVGRWVSQGSRVQVEMWDDSAPSWVAHQGAAAGGHDLLRGGGARARGARRQRDGFAVHERPRGVDALR
ncbi:MAG: matrixin family metalloprotease [Myxococcota bacterium]